MHELEPFYNWDKIYSSARDRRSPFYGRKYSEFHFRNTIYNYYIHPQWDEFGSATLYAKILYANYETGFGVIELMGEWNDLLYNDIMFLKRNVSEELCLNGVNKFILIGENVLNFHYSETDYYEEWNDELGEGWIVCLNFRDHVIREFERIHLDYYLCFGGLFNEFNWRAYNPVQLCDKIDQMMNKRLNP